MNAIAGFCLVWSLAGPPGSPLADLQRFPSAAVAWPSYRFAVRHCDWLAEVRDDSDWCAWLDWNGEAWHCRYCWDALADAWDRDPEGEYDGSHTLAWRLERLKRLRTMLGETDYFAGRMPPMVPIHRFSRRP